LEKLFVKPVIFQMSFWLFFTYVFLVKFNTDKIASLADGQ